MDNLDHYHNTNSNPNPNPRLEILNPLSTLCVTEKPDPSQKSP